MGSDGDELLCGSVALGVTVATQHIFFAAVRWAFRTSDAVGTYTWQILTDLDVKVFLLTSRHHRGGHRCVQLRLGTSFKACYLLFLLLAMVRWTWLGRAPSQAHYPSTKYTTRVPLW